MQVRGEICGREGLREFRETRLNLAICPSQLIALDPNAEMLWPKLLRTFGLPSLLQRLRPGMSERR